MRELSGRSRDRSRSDGEWLPDFHSFVAADQSLSAVRHSIFEDSCRISAQIRENHENLHLSDAYAGVKELVD